MNGVPAIHQTLFWAPALQCYPPNSYNKIKKLAS